MAETGHLVSSRIIRSIPRFYPANQKSHKFLFRTSRTVVVSRRKDFTLITKRSYKNPRRLISISTADGRWHGNWTCEYLLSLRDLHLQDLIEDEQKDADISINLTIQKHASFGLSVDGRIITSFTRKCSNCSSPYCREIDTNFNVWVLPSKRDNDAVQIPEIGGDDPSVIYVKPGHEANLDSLIQDTIRLTTSAKDSCSESCEKSESTFQYNGGNNAALVDKRWAKLLELKNATT